MYVYANMQEFRPKITLKGEPEWELECGPAQPNLFLLFLEFFSSCFFGSNLGVDFAMGLFGMQRDFAKEQALLAMDLVGV